MRLLALLPLAALGCRPAALGSLVASQSRDGALAWLSQFGDVPSCRPTRAFRKRQEGELFDREIAIPISPLDRLAGKSSQTAPYLGSNSVSVVHRAVDLLCSIQDREAKSAIADLASRQPCLPFLREALAGAGIDDGAAKAALTSASCTGVFWDQQDAMPGSPADQVYQRLLASAATPADFRELLRNAAARAGPLWRKSFARHDFATTDAAAALHRVAERSHLGLGEVVRDASRGLSGDELDDLYFVSVLVPATTGQLTALAAAELRRADPPAPQFAYPPPEKAFWQRVLGATAYSDPQSYAKVASKLEDQFKAKDRMALAASMNDRSRMVTQRMLAGSYLLKLGDEAGFAAFDELGSVSPEDRAAAIETLTQIRNETSPAVQQRLDKLLEGFPSAAEQRARKQALLKTLSVHQVH
jgi:hypothetical protein